MQYSKLIPVLYSKYHLLKNISLDSLILLTSSSQADYLHLGRINLVNLWMSYHKKEILLKRNIYIVEKYRYALSI